MKESAIAAELKISVHTVRTHFKRLHQRLDVHSRPEMLVRLFAALRSKA